LLFTFSMIRHQQLFLTWSLTTASTLPTSQGRWILVDF